MEAFLTKLGAWFWSFIPAALGSALSLYFGKEKTLLMSRVELSMVFIFGISIAHYLGGSVIEYSGIHISIIADAIKFTTGLIGMATLSHVLVQIPLAVTALRRKYLGGD
jgi:hypothetical protein